MFRLLSLLIALPLTASAQDFFDWTAAPDLPEPLGVAGPFVAAADDRLVVAGGAHFQTSPFAGGAKIWIDRAHELGPGNLWSPIELLPGPRGYGVSLPVEDGAVWIGGSDAERHYADAWRIRFDGETWTRGDLPPLPAPNANMGGAILNGVVYIAGGQAAPDATAAYARFWSLDLNSDNPVWNELEPWPGPGRILPVVAAQDGAVYVVSGAELIAAGSSVGRSFLTDGWRYRPGQGWARIEDAPRAFVAAPSIAWGPAHIFVFGGDDGRYFQQNDQLGDDHPGFPLDVWAYHTVTDRWTQRGETPFSHVTTTAVPFRGGVVIPSGEDRPGHRSPKIYLGEPKPSEARFTGLDYAALVVYLASLVAMGFYFSRRGGTTEDFFLAGRRVPWWAAGLSIYGTQLSSISFIAIPAKVYSTDWVYLLVQLSIVLVAFPVVWIYLPFFRRAPIVSAYEYLESRFNLPVRLFASASFILYQLGRMAIVLFLPAVALSTVTGIGVETSILLMGVLATLYTVLGGIEAVIWTDVVQVFVLLGGALLSLYLVLVGVDGGLSGLIAEGAAADKFHVFNWSWDWTTTAVWVVLIGNFFNNLVPYTSDQAVVQRYLTTRNEGGAARGIWLNAAMVPVSTLILFTLGTGLWSFYRTRPELLDPSQPADSIFPLFIAQQLPSGLAGLVIAGVFAASMSTLDSSLNSVSTAVVTDWYGRFRDAADKTKLRLARTLTALLGALATGVALVLATAGVGSAWDAFQAIMGLFGGALAGLFALGIFTRRANGQGALIGAVTGVIVLAWVQRNTPMHFFLYGLVGVGTCFVVGWAASWAFPAPPREQTAELTLKR